MWLPDQINDALATYLETIRPLDRYTQRIDDADTAPAWRRSDVPLAPERNTGDNAHLTFIVDCREGVAVSWAPSEVVYVAPVLLRFLYRIRPENASVDFERAKTAAHHLFAILHRPSADFPPDLDILSSGGWRADQSAKSTDFAVGQVTFNVQYSAPLTWAMEG